jgi:hypothetical protein
MPHGGLTTLDISLEPGSDQPWGKVTPSDDVAKLNVSLLRCVVLTHHLPRIVGAIERAIPSKTLGRIRLSIAQSELEINGRPALVFSIEAAALLRRLRARVLKAIAPGTVVVDACPSVSDFLSPSFIGPIVLSNLGVRGALRYPLLVRTVGVYEVEGPSSPPRKLLRRWAAPVPMRNTKPKR